MEISSSEKKDTPKNLQNAARSQGKELLVIYADCVVSICIKSLAILRNPRPFPL